jgi:uncharacterized protein YecT (DUF1311 family)
MCFACANRVKSDMQKMATDPQFQQQNKEFNEAFKKALEDSHKQQQPPPALPPHEAPPATAPTGTPTHK